jgi:hypothetical protein
MRQRCHEKRNADLKRPSKARLALSDRLPAILVLIVGFLILAFAVLAARQGL